MTPELRQLQNSVFSRLNFKMTCIGQDPESTEYHGHHFQAGQLRFQFRKAKITPKKIGQFVTLWKRNPENNKTEPFTDKDPFDFYLIFCNDEQKSGFFLFPKPILIQKQILTSLSKDGKRGFRVYPVWDFPENRQGLKTQAWQKDFFIDFSDTQYFEKLKGIHHF